MTEIQVGLIVVAGTTAVFAVAAGVLATLERAPGLRERVSASTGLSPSRALAVPEAIGACALLGVGIVSWLMHRESEGPLAAAAGLALLVHACSAFMPDGRPRRRVSALALYAMLLVVFVWGSLFHRR